MTAPSIPSKPSIISTNIADTDTVEHIVVPEGNSKTKPQMMREYNKQFGPNLGPGTYEIAPKWMKPTQPWVRESP